MGGGGGGGSSCTVTNACFRLKIRMFILVPSLACEVVVRVRSLRKFGLFFLPWITEVFTVLKN